MKTFTHWNYRIVLVDGAHAICEVFYNKTDAHSWAFVGALCAETLKDLKADFKLMNQAFRRPILKVKGNKLVELL